jgi:hypothetical protein
LRDTQPQSHQVLRLYDRPLRVGDVALAVLPHRDDAVTLLRGGGRHRRHHDLVADAGHVIPALDQVGHFEQPEYRDLRRHHRGGQRQVHRSELELLQHLQIAAELARSVDHDLRGVAQARIGAPGELLRGPVEQRFALSDVPELDLDLSLGGRRQQRKAEQQR